MIPEGTYVARVIEHEPGYSSKKGTPQVRLKWGLKNGGQEGVTLDQYLYFTELSSEIAFKVLDAAGWDGNDEVDLVGVGSVDAEIVVKHEEYEGKVRERIAFVNKPGEGPQMSKPVEDKAEFRRVMRAMRAVSGIGPAQAKPATQNDAGEDDLPF